VYDVDSGFLAIFQKPPRENHGDVARITAASNMRRPIQLIDVAVGATTVEAYGEPVRLLAIRKYYPNMLPLNELSGATLDLCFLARDEVGLRIPHGNHGD
jgi:hypothetical protein